MRLVRGPGMRGILAGARVAPSKHCRRPLDGPLFFLARAASMLASDKE